MAKSERSHSFQSLETWKNYVSIVASDRILLITGRDLTVAEVVAASRNVIRVRLSTEMRQDLSRSSEALQSDIIKGGTVYGVNTGFGGSADTRTDKFEDLQRALLRELQYGILETKASNVLKQHSVPRGHDYEGFGATQCMPESWTRASMLIRLNSLTSGYSGVRPTLLDGLIDLLNHDIVPRIPLRGSISASGDLSPLSYIGGALQGKMSVEVWKGPRDARICSSAYAALVEHKLPQMKIGPKEALALVNGTSVSCATAVLALHDANMLALLSQMLTSMSVEALAGTRESFDPIFGQVRPHSGQADVSRNVWLLLQGSKMTSSAARITGVLQQDRYSIRTAAQWLGPVLEDLLLAQDQLLIESNSVTDNPIIDSEGTSFHGGNFQAKSVTSAMEKTRLGLQTMGRMLFTQATEMINPSTSRGLPPNLVIDDPSLSFIMKAVDLAAAALLSELGFLANPVGSHVQTAEMGNQSLNSLALISARYTHVANDVTSMLSAYHLLAACQALDIRAMNFQFFEVADRIVVTSLEDHLSDILQMGLDEHGNATMEETTRIITRELRRSFESTVSYDISHRFEYIANSLRSALIDHNLIRSDPKTLETLAVWRQQVAKLLGEQERASREAYIRHGNALSMLGPGSKWMYSYVRYELNIPLLHTEILRTPEVRQADDSEHEIPEFVENPTVGSYVTRIYNSIRDGQLYKTVAECFDELPDLEAAENE